MADKNASTISSPGDDRLTVVLHEFEAEWRRGRRPALWKHVPAPGEPNRAESIRELVHLDMTYRIRAGDDVPLVEWYLQAFPDELSTGSDHLELIAAEYQ